MGLGVNTLNEKKTGNNANTQRAKDYVTNKLLLVFTIAFAMLLLLMNVGRMMKSVESFVLAHTITKVVCGVAILAIVAGIIMMIVEHNKKKDTRYVLLSGKNILITALFIAVCTGALAFIFDPKMLLLLYVFVPVIVVLYIIYYSYQREFFYIALSAAISASCVWLVGSTGDSRLSFVLAAVGVLVNLVLAAFAVWAQVKGGTVRAFGREFSAFKADSKYALVYISFALFAAVCVAALLLPSFAVYFTFGTVAYLVLAGIYYTIKLI